MKTFAFVAMLAAFAGCTTLSPEEKRERAITRRYAVCMDQTLGSLGGAFATAEARRQASETCIKVMQAN